MARKVKFYLQNPTYGRKTPIVGTQTCTEPRIQNESKLVEWSKGLMFLDGIAIPSVRCHRNRTGTQESAWLYFQDSNNQWHKIREVSNDRLATYHERAYDLSETAHPYLFTQP
jgi:hypothetical protein